MPHGIGVLTIHTRTMITYDVAWERAYLMTLRVQEAKEKVHPRSPSHPYPIYIRPAVHIILACIFLSRYLNDLV